MAFEMRAVRSDWLIETGAPSIANASSSKLVDSIVLKLLLININDFKLGFDHVSNRIDTHLESLASLFVVENFFCHVLFDYRQYL